ncbi:MAG TPA: hypothetical protein VIT85_03450 [Solirubrobacterales bacterium]
MRLFRAELLKLATVRTTWVMLGIGLLVEALFAGLYTGLVNVGELDREGIEGVQTSTGLLMVMLLVLGVLAITGEFRHGTASTTFLASPRRHPAMLAKLAAVLVFGALAGVAFVVVNGGLTFGLLGSRDLAAPPAGDVFSIYAGVLVSFALLCGFGLGVGAIVRNQVGAIIAALAFFFILSPLPELLPGNIGHYFPSQAVGSLHGSQTGVEEGLAQVAGGFVLAAWVLGLVAIGTVLVVKRDVSD